MLATLDRLRLFNVREFVAHLGRTSMAVAVTAVSAALLVAVIGISGSITGSVDQLGSSIGGNAEYEVSGVTDAGFEQSLQPEVARVPGVQAAVPMIRASIGSPNGNLLLIGFDPLAGQGWRSDVQQAVLDQTGGGTELLTVRNGVLVGHGTGWSKGQKVILGDTEVTVAAVVDGDAVERINDGNFVMTTLGLAQQLVNRAGSIDSMLLVTDPGADLDEVRTAVDDTVAGRAVVADPTFRAAQAGGVIAVLQSTTLMAAALGLVVAGFLIYNAMSMAINQRRNVISIVRAIGGNKRAIFRDLLAEAAILSAIGAVIGVGIGMLMGRWTIGLLPATFMQSLQVDIAYSLPWFTVPVVVAACVVSGVGAAAVAARAVYKVAPIEALAPVGVSSADKVGLPLRLVAGVLGAAAIVLSIAAAWIDLGLWSIVSVAMFLNGAVFVCFAFFHELVAATAAVARLFGTPGAVAAATIARAPRRIWVTVISVLIAVSMMVSVTGSNTNGVDSAAAAFSPAGPWTSGCNRRRVRFFPPVRCCRAISSRRSGHCLAWPPWCQASWRMPPSVDRKWSCRDLRRERSTSLYEAISEPSRAKVLAGEGVVVSRDIARVLDVEAGGTLTVPTPNGFENVQVLEVFPYFSALTGFVGMSLPLMQQWFDRPDSTLLEVTVDSGADRAAVQAAIEGVVPSSVNVYSGREVLDGMTASLQQATVLISAITWIVVFVAAVALVNTMMLSVLERRRELGVLRAMGSSRRFTMRTVLVEAAAIGIVGGLCGLVVGVLNQYVNTIAFSHVLGLDIAFQLTPPTVVFGLAALLLSLLGAIPPGLHATRLNVIDAVSVD
ncbi:ABC transporter permease [Antrihabitans spumae]|uniref:ABC transporter permease n=1 Tax=Antrihabitans spumae TaxID=3373370 RepID=A0ABW7KG41_9NOCA